MAAADEEHNGANPADADADRTVGQSALFHPQDDTDAAQTEVVRSGDVPPADYAQTYVPADDTHFAPTQIFPSEGGDESEVKSSPSRLGNYELLGEIGRGGMGVVYRARQLAADRIVALKVIRRDQLEPLTGEMHTTAIDRFRKEVQAAARLEHEHIVTLYEVGEAEGNHFFSMQYVEGQSLAELVRNGPMKSRQAAAYLEPVARAVSEAHTQGILHRDIKPQNILVDSKTDKTLVADFGLAKFSGQAEELTRAGQVLGTPAYMAPEQAKDSARVGEPMDVYAIGATLYHLLTGRPPFHAATMMETLRQVIDEEPARPSDLNRSIDRDAETICLKCLQKEPSRRYASAEALADDLKRYIEGKPILARPIGTAGRTLRWCRRNPVMATLIGSTATALILALIATAAGYYKTSAALTTAENAQKQSEQSFRQARGAVDTFFTLVSEDTLLNQPGLQPLRKELLNEALDYYERFLVQRDNDPAIRDELATAYFRVGRITEEIDSPEKALDAYQHALKMQILLAEETPDDRSRQTALGDTHNAIGKVLVRTGKPDQALDFFREAIVIRDRLAKTMPDDSEPKRTLANCRMNLGLAEKELRDPDRAQREFELAQAIREELVRNEPTNDKTRRDLAIGYFNLANLAMDSGDAAAAQFNLQNAKAGFEKLTENHPEDLANQYRLVICCRVLADLKSKKRQWTDAESLYEDALSGMENLANANPDVSEYQAELARLYMNVGELQREQQQLDAALESFDQARQILKRVVDAYPEVGRHRRDLVVLLIAIADLQSAAGQDAAARADLETARQRAADLVDDFPGSEQFETILNEVTAKVNQLAREPSEKR